MKTFEFIRPTDAGTAITTAAQAKTAQQGAEVRYIAGGTTLIDLMKLNVETPARVPGNHRQQPHAGGPRDERTLHRDQSFGHVHRDGRVGSDCPCAGAERLACYPLWGISCASRQHTAPGNSA